MTKENITYKEAIGEIEQILNQVEEGETDVDKLTDKVKRVVYLLKICRDKLYRTEQEINKVIEEVAGEESKQEEEKE